MDSNGAPTNHPPVSATTTRAPGCDQAFGRIRGASGKPVACVSCPKTWPEWDDETPGLTLAIQLRKLGLPLTLLNQ